MLSRRAYSSSGAGDGRVIGFWPAPNPLPARLRRRSRPPGIKCPRTHRHPFRITAHPMGPAPPLVKIDAVPACHFPPQLLLRIRSDLRRLCQSHIPLRAAGEEMQPNIDKNRSERRAGRVAKPRFFLSFPLPSQGVSILIGAVFPLMCRFSLMKRKGQRFSYLKTAVPGRWYAMVSQG